MEFLGAFWGAVVGWLVIGILSLLLGGRKNGE